MSKLSKFDVIYVKDIRSDITNAFVIVDVYEKEAIGYNKKYLQYVVIDEYSTKHIKKEQMIQVIVKEDEFETLAKRVMNGGVFYHKLSKMFEKIYKNIPAFVAFIHPTLKIKIIFKLSKAEKVIKTIGYESNGSYQKIRVGTPMVKLILADRIL